MRDWTKDFILRCWRAVEIHSGVASASAAFYIGGLLVTDPALHWVALLSYGMGTALLLWGGRIHGMHLWQSWWRGRPSPFTIVAGVHAFDYEQGAMVAGIPWQQGFPHVWVRITNDSLGSLDVDAVFAPDHPIICRALDARSLIAASLRITGRCK